ncbi:sialate:O-sulfotransferase 2-like [Tubulanus polymorphus]|uniref:sialate:O-sulfotransferase 2-like n=1 Tax=Tubulanus polymorphus TaxID=672921 RepID=UPI003DA3B8DD
MFTKTLLIALAFIMVVGADSSAEFRKYVGCYKDSHKRDMIASGARDRKGMTVGKCITICKGKGYRFAGLQFSWQCFCSNRVGYNGPAEESECNKRCTGNRREICGGSWRNSVYSTMRSSKHL